MSPGSAPRSRTSPSGSLRSFLREEDQRQAEEPDGGEEHEGVLLDAARLHEPQDAARLRGGHADAVDDAVDALLVEDVVGEAAGDPGAVADAVDDAVDDLLIGPVRGPGQRAFDEADDSSDKEVV